jgi:hypothetical protein
MQKIVRASLSSGPKSSRGESSRYPIPFGGVLPRLKGLGEYDLRLKMEGKISKMSHYLSYCRSLHLFFEIIEKIFKQIKMK